MQSISYTYDFVEKMSIAGGRPPSLTTEEASRVITKHFNFKKVYDVSIKAFPSYRDRNYFFEGECVDEPTKEFVFKLSNPLSTSVDVMEGVNEVMKHLHSKSMLTPYPLCSRRGKDLVQLTNTQLKKEDDTVDKNSMKYPVYVLSYIPGKIFDEVNKKHLTPALLYEVGELLGKMDKELMNNFSNKFLSSRKNYDWDLMHFEGMRKYLHELSDPLQVENGEKIFKAFEEHVAPKIPLFKRGIIHGDLNGLNIVLQEKLSGDGYRVAGFIDFNDSVKTCVIFELGISLAYIMQENTHPVTCSNVVEFVGPMISAYNSVVGLNAEEIDCLYYLILARCCQTALNGIRAHKAEPWNSYLLTTPQKSWLLIEELINTPKCTVDDTWKDCMNS